MLHVARFLMSWLTGKRAHILSIFLFLSLKAVICLFFSAQSHTLTVWYMNKSFIFCTFFIFFAPHFGSCTPTVLCPAVTLLLCLSLFCHFGFSLPLSLSSHPPHCPSCIVLFASSFYVMPQGPPGPQGSPHPQPPPPNSMMGPHSQVTLPFSLILSFFFTGFAMCSHVARLVLSADASCFGICFSLKLYAAFSIHTTWNLETRVHFKRHLSNLYLNVCLCCSLSCRLALLEAQEVHPSGWPAR